MATARFEATTLLPTPGRAAPTAIRRGARRPVSGVCPSGGRQRPVDNIRTRTTAGGAVDDSTVAALRARIICGGANNQLAHPGVDKLLVDHGIVYAPDYVVNAGGVIQVADELEGFNFERARAKAEQIYTTTKRILALAGQEGVPPSVAADQLAERRMAEVGRLRGIWLGT